jgi:uncharacterized membrane protein YuzA (DUF378 family)
MALKSLYDPSTNTLRKESAVKKLDILAAALVIVGALNWGLVAIAEFDLVATIVGLDFGETNVASRVVYALVGLAAVYEVAQPRSVLRSWGRDRHVATA